MYGVHVRSTLARFAQTIVRTLALEQVLVNTTRPTNIDKLGLN